MEKARIITFPVSSKARKIIHMMSLSALQPSQYFPKQEQLYPFFFGYV
ncbi:MAG: hypothetical protein ACI8RD_003919 [Bacillariaceae sp.]|jgi:hypothetical protein